MRGGGTHFGQGPTALDLPPRGGGAQLKRHPPTHRLTNTKENMSETNFRLPSKPPTHSWPHQKEASTVLTKAGMPPPPPRWGRVGEARNKGLTGTVTRAVCSAAEWQCRWTRPITHCVPLTQPLALSLNRPHAPIDPIRIAQRSACPRCCNLRQGLDCCSQNPGPPCLRGWLGDTGGSGLPGTWADSPTHKIRKWPSGEK